MLGPFLCGLVAQAPLIPKLRGHFAEFLDNTSPAGLGILFLSTCVGFRYGHHMSHSGFSRRAFPTLRYFLFAPLNDYPLQPGFFIPDQGLRLPRAFHSRVVALSRVPAVLSCGGAVISNCYPSATPFGLALGPDLPREDQLYPGNLGHPAVRILTSLSLLIPAFSLPCTPLPLSVQLLHPGNAPLPMYLHTFRSFGTVF